MVYTNSGEGPIRPRTIGRKFLKEFQDVKAFQRYGHKDRYTESQMTLFSVLGICIGRCQQIEHLIAHSFILAALSPSERKRNLTIKETINKWKRKTFGQMILAIEEGYEIEPTVHASLKLLLEMRNKLVHELTRNEQYNIDTSWGQDEMIAFLSLFELISRPLREAFEASLYASIEIGNNNLLADIPDQHVPLTKNQKKKISLFAAFFPQKKRAKYSCGLNKS